MPEGTNAIGVSFQKIVMEDEFWLIVEYPKILDHCRSAFVI